MVLANHLLHSLWAGRRSMPKYQMYFDTNGGESKHNVDIDENETLAEVLNDILQELREFGGVLRGNGQPQVKWSGNLLDLNAPLHEQGVRPYEVLYVSTIPDVA